MSSNHFLFTVYLCIVEVFLFNRCQHQRHLGLKRWDFWFRCLLNTMGKGQRGSGVDNRGKLTTAGCWSFGHLVKERPHWPSHLTPPGTGKMRRRTLRDSQLLRWINFKLFLIYEFICLISLPFVSVIVIGRLCTCLYRCIWLDTLDAVNVYEWLYCCSNVYEWLMLLLGLALIKQVQFWRTS